MCPTCGWSTAPLPRRLTGGLGTVHTYRKNLRKRHAVRVVAGLERSTLLMATGQLTDYPAADIPDEGPDLFGKALPYWHTPHARLIHLATGIQAGTLAEPWDATVLLDHAFADASGDRVTARLLAEDLLSLGRVDLLDRLPLCTTEHDWLRLVLAANRRDIPAALSALARLPPSRYRHKLPLILALWPWLDLGPTEVAVVTEQIASFDDEPVTAILLRALDTKSVSLEQLQDDISWLRSHTVMAGELADQVDGARQLLHGSPPANAAFPLLTGSTRVLQAHASGGKSADLQPADLVLSPLSVLDDLLDNGAVTSPLIDNAPLADDVRLYLRARKTPQELSDPEVDEVGHTSEALRRAFLFADAKALDRFPDSPTLRHYRSLVALQRNRPEDMQLEEVRPQDRDVASHLLALLRAKATDRDLAEALTSRLLDDPTVWPVIMEMVGAQSIHPTPEVLAEHRAFGEWLALFQAREDLFLGQWGAAVEAGKRCLALARDESVRDEALNLIACGHHQLGNAAAAVAALESALEGNYSEALLANLGIVAEATEPERAATYLCRLVLEGRSIALRVAAAHRAARLWLSDPNDWKGDEHGEALAEVLRAPLRLLVNDPISLDDFREIGQLLSQKDSAWMSAPANLARSPHRNSLEAQYFVARAQPNLSPRIAVIGNCLRTGTAPDWIVSERDAMRAQAVEILIDHLDDPDTLFGGVALEMVDHGLITDPPDVVLFNGLGIAGITYHLTERDTELADQYVARTHQTRAIWSALPSDDRTRLTVFIELAVRRVAINRVSARRRDFNKAIETYNGSLTRLRQVPANSAPHFQALNNVRGVLQQAVRCRQEILQFLPIVDHEGVRADIDELAEATRQLERACLNVLR